MTLGAAVLALALSGCNQKQSVDHPPAKAPEAKQTAAPSTPAAGANSQTQTPATPPAQANGGKMVTNPSGLQYEDLVVGTGPSPARGESVQVHYTGWLTDGSKFDSSKDRGTPFVFPLGMGRVIKGWDEGVASMKVGGKRKLIIPANLGYGAQGAGGVIPPNATLVFEVELLGIQ
ncbi:MAG: FKBP-type peptidyl-prolyl cis-trans isomerase [Candidatus Eisenbacteria bacterium]|nr:FKBP-type peptidyl-prolyl cis-trans isomerase [Candidatus Eisenbacteria bacterium]MCC7143440.1 FKBP-type peptidyl-prolyl cis-trans isomerase [Candidatus Eisenbacteria bacterium]